MKDFFSYIIIAVLPVSVVLGITKAMFVLAPSTDQPWMAPIVAIAIVGLALLTARLTNDAPPPGQLEHQRLRSTTVMERSGEMPRAHKRPRR